jgi:hypothetical protein
MYNLNYAPTTLGVQIELKSVSRGKGGKKVEYHCSRLPISYPMGTGALFLGVKRPGREADHSPPSSAEFKNE